MVRAKYGNLFLMYERVTDQNFAHVSAWEYKGAGKAPVMHKEPLDFEYVKLTQRSYK